MRLPLVLVLLGALGACTVDLVEPSDRACDERHACQSGQTCVDGVCTFEPPAESGDDGGTPSDAVVVRVAPSSLAVASGQQAQFTAEVSGTANTQVTWSLTPADAGATISADGLFTASQTEGTFEVTATSSADPTRSGSATVTVQMGPPSAGLIAHFAADHLRGWGAVLPEDGAAVSEWKDLSGKGNHLTQADPTRQPLFNANAENGLPSIVFDGQSEVLVGPVFATPDAQANTVVLVFRAIDKQVTFVDSPQAAGVNRHRLKMAPLGSSGGWTVQMNAGSFASPPQKALAVGTVVRSIHVFNGSQSSQRFNNEQYTGDIYGSLGTGGLGGIQLGLKQDGNPEDGVNSGQPEILEVIYYDHALSGAEITAVESYLSKRFVQ